jgi:hypothetical protein
VTFAEVYPSLLRAQPRRGEVKDQAQVRTLAEHFASLDGAGELAELLTEPLDADAGAIEAALREEGWILGVR